MLFLWCAGVLACAAFVQQQTTTWQRIALPACCLLAGFIAWVGWKNAVTGRLQWDGELWYWTHFDNIALRELTILLDLQRFILVKLVSKTGHARWLWLQTQHADAQWLALRRALVYGCGVSPAQDENPVAT